MSFLSKTGLRPDIASIIILSIIVILFFDFIYSLVKMYFNVLNMGVSLLETVWPIEPSEGGIYYTAYSNVKQLFTYITSVGTDKYAVAVMLAISIVLLAFELEIK